MPEHVSLITHIFFWALATGVLFLPHRWAILCWLLTAHLDLSGTQWQSATAMGWGNTIKIIGLPTVLLIRIGIKNAFSSGLRVFPFRIWLLICLYTTFASLWTPFFLSALKQIGYLYAYSIGFLVLLVVWQTGKISSRTIIMYVWFTLGLAILQTFFLGNPFGHATYGIERLTSFTAQQLFSESLVSIFVLILFLPDIKPLQKFLYSELLLFQLILNGGRMGLVGTFIMLIIVFFIYLKPKVPRRILKGNGIVFAGLLLAILFYYLFASSSSSRFRALDLISVAKSDIELSDIGTMGFRLSMWKSTLYQINNFSTLDCLFGRGTSSSADIALKSFSISSSKSIDANRIIHNEYLRIFYEWGIIGSIMFLAFLLFIVGSSITLAKRNNIGGLALVSFMPMLLITLGLENILAGTGGPGGIGFLLVFTFAIVFSRRGKKSDVPQAICKQDIA